MENLITTFKEKIEDFASPFMSSFIISWIIVNHKYLLITFGTLETKEKLDVLSNYSFSYNLNTQYLSTIWYAYSFWIPLFAALFYVYIYPFFSNKFYSKAMINKSEKENIKYDKYTKALHLDMQKLQTKIIEKEQKINDQQKVLISIEEKLKKENQIEIDNLNIKYDEERKELRNNYLDNEKILTTKHQEEISNQNNRHDIEMNNLQNRHQEEIERLKENYESSIKELENKNKRISKEYERKINNLNKEIKEYKKEINLSLNKTDYSSLHEYLKQQTELENKLNPSSGSFHDFLNTHKELEDQLNPAHSSLQEYLDKQKELADKLNPSSGSFHDFLNTHKELEDQLNPAHSSLQEYLDKQKELADKLNPAHSSLQEYLDKKRHRK